MRNLRVLATDQRTSDEKDEKGNTVVHTFSTVTVEATPKIAEKIAVAQTLGTLSLSLRSIADNACRARRGDRHPARSTFPTRSQGGKGRCSSKLASTPQAGSSSTFATGADVSRFQRSSVPGKPAGETPGGGSPAHRPHRAAAFRAATPITGPMVRVARGNSVTDVPVGGKN